MKSAARAEAILLPLGQGALQQPPDIIRDRRLVVGNLGVGDCLLPFVWFGGQPGSSQEMEKDRPERVNIRLTARHSGDNDLRSEIRVDEVGRGDVVDQRQQVIADPESRHHSLAIVGDKHQTWVEKPVDDSLAVDLHRQGGGQRERDLLENQQSVVYLDRKLLFSYAVKNQVEGLRRNVIVRDCRLPVGHHAIDSGGEVGRLNRGRNLPGCVRTRR